MNIEAFRDFCLSKKAVTEHFPFDEVTLVFKVKNKMFALCNLDKWERGETAINLKCDPDKALLLREEYTGIAPGYHMNKRLWNTVTVNNSDVSTILLKELITHSYNMVVKGLSKKVQKELEDL